MTKMVWPDHVLKMQVPLMEKDSMPNSLCSCACPQLYPISCHGLSLRGEKIFVTPTEMKVHGDALCFVVMGPSLLQRLVVGGWRLVVGGGWRRLAVGGWRLVVPRGRPQPVIEVNVVAGACRRMQGL